MRSGAYSELVLVSPDSMIACRWPEHAHLFQHEWSGCVQVDGMAESLSPVFVLIFVSEARSGMFAVMFLTFACMSSSLMTEYGRTGAIVSVDMGAVVFEVIVVVKTHKQRGNFA